MSSAISCLYQSHPEVLPQPAEWNSLAVLVVKLLAGFRMANKEGRDEEEEEKEFFRETDEVSKILPLIWGQSDATDGVDDCLKAFYIIISTEGRGGVSHVVKEALWNKLITGGVLLPSRVVQQAELRPSQCHRQGAQKVLGLFHQKDPGGEQTATGGGQDCHWTAGTIPIDPFMRLPFS